MDVIPHHQSRQSSLVARRKNLLGGLDPVVVRFGLNDQVPGFRGDLALSQLNPSKANVRGIVSIASQVNFLLFGIAQDVPCYIHELLDNLGLAWKRFPTFPVG